MPNIGLYTQRAGITQRTRDARLMLNQCWAGIELTSVSYLVFVANGDYPANTTLWNNDVLMLPQRLRRWPNIKTSLFQRVVFGSCNKSLVCEKVVRLWPVWPVRLLRPWITIKKPVYILC